MTKSNPPDTYQLSIGEQHLIDQIRDLQDKNSRVPMHVILRYHDGLWQFYQSIPAGHVKEPRIKP